MVMVTLKRDVLEEANSKKSSVFNILTLHTPWKQYQEGGGEI
jgi:hypothetical protein